MTKSADPGREPADRQTYEIRLVGRLHTRWAEWLEGMSVTTASDGTTTLTGTVADQAALHGVLNRIRDLGAPIVSVRRLCNDEKDATS